MKMFEIVLPKHQRRDSYCRNIIDSIDILRDKVQCCIEILIQPNISKDYRDYLEIKIKNAANQIRSAVGEVTKAQQVNESTKDRVDITEMIKLLFERPIPAIIASAAVFDLIDDNDLHDTIVNISNSNPSADMRPVISDWLMTHRPEMVSKFIRCDDFSNNDGLSSTIGSKH